MHSFTTHQHANSQTVHRQKKIDTVDTVHVHVQLPPRQDAQPPVPWRHIVEGAETPWTPDRRTHRTLYTRRDSSNAVFTVSHLFRGHTPHILIHAPRPLHSVLRDGSPLRLRKYTELSLPSRLHPALRTPLGLLPQIPAGAPVAPDSGSPPHRCAQTSEYTPA